MPRGPDRVWVDGRLLDVAEPVVPAHDGAFTAGLGCYSTGMFREGSVRWGTRVAGRLVRDAEVLGLPGLDTDVVLAAMEELGNACFGTEPGIVRMQASADADGTLHLIGTARDLGADPATWRVRTSPWSHEGPGPFTGVKLTGHPLLALVRSWVRAHGADEALLHDEAGRLVEGSRSSLVVCDAAGKLITPPRMRGGVASVTLGILQEKIPELTEADIDAETLDGAREIVAVNAARGVRPVLQRDGDPVASGRPGSWSQRLAAALDSEP